MTIIIICYACCLLLLLLWLSRLNKRSICLRKEINELERTLADNKTKKFRQEIDLFRMRQRDHTIEIEELQKKVKDLEDLKSDLQLEHITIEGTIKRRETGWKSTPTWKHPSEIWLTDEED